MKTSTLFWTVIVLVILFGGWYYFTVSQSHENNTMATSTPTSAVTFFCDEGALAATFASSSVQVIFPDGSLLNLPQTISGSGARYEASSTVFWNKGDNAFVTVNGTNTFTNCVAGAISTTGEISTYTDQGKTFSFSFPTNANIKISGGDGSYSQSWRSNATTSGMLLVKAALPSSFEPGTNLANSQFTVGVSSDPSAIASCLRATNGEKQAQNASTTIQGITYSVFTLGDAGAGNIYDTTSYRAVNNGMCYAIEYTIHSLNIGNFDPSQHVVAFDATKVRAVFDQMVRSFTFLE